MNNNYQVGDFGAVIQVDVQWSSRKRVVIVMDARNEEIAEHLLERLYEFVEDYPANGFKVDVK